MKGKGHWQLLIIAAAVCLLFLSSFVAASLSTDPPPWEPKFPPQVTTTQNGNTSTLTMQKRDYTKEDGTKVSEERMIQVITDKDGKTLYTIVNTWLTEENGSERLKVRTRSRSEKGKVESWEQREDSYTIPELPGCVITDFWEYVNGVLVSQGCSKRWEVWPPKEPVKPADKQPEKPADKEPVKPAVKEKEEVKPNQQGKPAEKTSYRCMSDGVLLVDTHIWDDSKSDWVISNSTQLIRLEPAKVVAPTTCSIGYAVGGSIGDEQGKIIATASVVAISGDGKRIEVPVEPDGTWELPPDKLAAGIWRLFTLAMDGREGESSTLVVFPKGTKRGEPTISNLPKLCFVGSNLRLQGNGFSSTVATRPPDVCIQTDEGTILIKPLAYSDTEVLLSFPNDIPRGPASIFLCNGEAFTNELETQVISFDIIAPEVIIVGQEFIVTVRLTGLSGDLANLGFEAMIRITGPAGFIGPSAKEVLVELKGGIAQIRAKATSSGQFYLSGEIIRMPNL